MEKPIVWIPVKEYLIRQEWEKEWTERQNYILWNGSIEGYEKYRIERENNKKIADDIFKRNKLNG